MVTSWSGPPAMMAIFTKLFGSFSCPHIIKQNNFSNLQHYFLQKVRSLFEINNTRNKLRAFYSNTVFSLQTIPVSMAGLRNAHGLCPPDVLKFLFDLIKYNDNSKNRYSDNYYRAALIDALSATITPVISLSEQGLVIFLFFFFHSKYQ